MELNELTISEAADGLRKKKFSSKDLVDASMTAIGGKDGDIKAFVYVDENGAYESAKRVDKMLAEGKDLPVLAGIPAGIKDIINTKGVKTTCCSPILRDFIPPYNATVIERLKENHIVMIGKTN